MPSRAMRARPIGCLRAAFLFGERPMRERFLSRRQAVTAEVRLVDSLLFTTKPPARPVRPPARGLGGRGGLAQYPAASAPLARVSAAPTSPAGVTAIELAEPEVGPTRTLWPRATSARTVS